MSAHPFSDTGYRTHDGGKRICRCGQVEAARAHDLPGTPEDVKAVEARKLGENEGAA